MESRHDDRSRKTGAGHDVMGKATITIGNTGDIEEGKGRAFDVGEKRIAVFNIAGDYQAIDDACPHAGASLAEGYIEDGKVGCPWHYAEFDLHSGKHLNAPASCGIATYKVFVEDKKLLVEV